MFLWRWLFGRRKSARDIFTFHDGTRTRHADPVYLWRVLEERCGEDPMALFDVISTTPPPAPEGVDVSATLADLKRRQADATKRLAEAAAVAFGVEQLKDGGGDVGLTEWELLHLAARLAAYLGGLAAEARPFASS